MPMDEINVERNNSTSVPSENTETKKDALLTGPHETHYIICCNG